MDIDNKDKKTDLAIQPARKNAIAGTWLILAGLAGALYVLLSTSALSLSHHYQHLITNISLATAIGALILAVAAFAEKLILKRAHTSSQGYNGVQAIRLISILVVIGIFVSFLFQNWYTAIASLGLISLILGFALQTPISSFIGWLYIVFRAPYHVTDRIQINGYKGNVVEIGYLDTTLWEFGGDYLSNDLPSGRLIRFPNSLVLQSAVFNYSWHKFPYIWNEIPFHVAYESDLDFVANTIREITRQEIGEAIPAHVEELKVRFSETPVGDIHLKEFPYISFRTNANTWIEVSVTYLVEPKQAADMRSRILKKVVAGLLQQPDKVMFPKTNSR